MKISNIIRSKLFPYKNWENPIKLEGEKLFNMKFAYKEDFFPINGDNFHNMGDKLHYRVNSHNKLITHRFIFFF